VLLFRVHERVATHAAAVSDFVWGVATAAFQIEGAWDADGKAPSVWDTLRPREVTCDHYHRWEEDLDLVADLGVTSYRFSMSWPRALTEGGLDFYDRLVDGMLARGVEPTVTLYHWDHPQWVEDAGGWLSADTPSHMADYAARVADRLGDRVTRWITLNEPQSVLIANILGVGRPAGPLGRRGLDTVPNMVLAHERLVEVLRPTGAPVGIALNLTGFEGEPEYVAKAEACEDRLFLDPVLAGPAIDFLGINWYSPARVIPPKAVPPDASDLDRLFGGLADIFGYSRENDAPHNMLGGTVRPAALASLLAWVRATYDDVPPIYVTENGLAMEGDDVHDAPRIEYLRGCIDAVRADGDVRGYFVWSLLDNLEWGLGYRPRFGLVHVDFDTLKRTPKDSFRWYRDLIASTSA
jgi:beta-glucosidase